MNRPIDDYRQHDVNHKGMLQSSVLSVASMVMSIGAATYISLAPETSKDLAKVLIPIGLCSGISALASTRVLEETKYILQDYRDIYDQQRTNRIYQEAMPVVQLNASLDDLKPFNWSTFKYKYDQYPHIGILASSGSGKSMLAEYIASLFTDSITIAVDPHYEIGHYSTAQVLVTNRDEMNASLKQLADIPKFYDILHGTVQPTIPEFIASLYEEMQYRLQLDPVTGKFQGRKEPEVNVIFDEYNSYSDSRGVGVVTKKMLRESRKARLRNIYVCQNSDVSALGLEPGNGSVRSNITWVRIGEEAVRYGEARLQMVSESEREYWTRVLKAFKKDLVPCMVEDEYAVVPYVVT